MEYKGANLGGRFASHSELAAVQIIETYAAECKSSPTNLDCENRNKFSYVIYSVPGMGRAL